MAEMSPPIRLSATLEPRGIPFPAAMRCCCRPARLRSSLTQQRPADDPRWPAQPRAARSRRGRDAAIAWSRTLARVGAGRYNARMRRPTRLGLAVVVLLIAILGAYGAFWFVVAGRLEDGVTQWAQSLRAQNLDLSWRAIRVGGFPLGFRVALSEARLRDLAATPKGDVQVPLLSGSAAYWNFRVWQLTAPEGLSATANLGAGGVAKVTVGAASGSVVVADDGGGTL